MNNAAPDLRIACPFRLLHRLPTPVPMFRSFLLVVALLAGGLQASRADGPFPVADPTVVEGHNGDRGYFAVGTGRGAQMLHSRDLKEWKSLGRVFPTSAPEWAMKAIPKHQGIWAPDLTFHDGWYHLYYSVSSFGSQRSVIGLAVNKRLEPGHRDNRWEDRGLVIESDVGTCDFNAIDPALFVDSKGRWLLFFGSFWTGLKAIELDPRTGKAKEGKPKIVPIARRAPEVKDGAIEAAFVVRRGPWHYLFASWDQCCRGAESDYRVVVGRSRDPLGPYVDKTGKPMLEGGGTLVIQSDLKWAGPGHNGVLQTRRGDCMVLHAYERERPFLGRLFHVRPMTWSADGWPELGELVNVP